MADTLKEGWYLGLPYMQGVGLRAMEPGEIPASSPRDFLFVDDVLGLCPDWRATLRRWWDHLEIGAHLILWLSDCMQKEVSGHRFTYGLVDCALDGIDGWEQLECDAVGDHLFAVYRKVETGQARMPWRKASQHTLIIRAGAYGDAIMASSVFPLLRAEGWTVDLLTGAAGEEALRCDPHLERILVTQKMQVPDAELGAYWAAHGRRYDRVINLAFSVEGELLKQPWRGDYFWSDDQRRSLCDRSYLQRVHDLSGVTGNFGPRFHASKDEKDFARHIGRQHGPFILWCLRGSAVHKWWPYTAQAVCRVLSHSRARIILSGDETAKEMGADVMGAVAEFFGETDRVVNLVEKLSMRQAMALAQEAALVIGPETGVLNAVSFEPNAKIVLLSHSSSTNLTNDWVNTTALVPSSACYPCHRLHYSHEHCPQDEMTGAARCAASIKPDQLVPLVLEKYRKALSAPINLKGYAA